MLGILIAWVLSWFCSATAYVLDGTVTPTVIDYPYNFNDGDSALGLVYFKKGFAVSAGETVTLGLLCPVDGPINLNGTGTVKINAGTTLSLGYNSEGFPTGGIIQDSSDFNCDMNIFSDIIIGGQLEFRNGGTINMQNNTITLAEDGASRGSLMINIAADSPSADNALTLLNGTIVGAQDFTTGFGPRLRSGTLVRTTNSSSTAFFTTNITFVLSADSTMTVTNCQFSAYQGSTSFKCQSRATVRLQTGYLLFSNASLYLSPGIVFFNNIAEDTHGFAFSSYNTNNAIHIDNATVQSDKSFGMGSGNTRVFIDGATTIRGIGERQNFFMGEVFDIGAGARLTMDNMYISHT